MNLIFALGNIGDKYANTRHNMGFLALDFYLGKNSFQNTSKSLIKIINKTIFAKPKTLMNLSGISMHEINNLYEINRILVIHDDLDMSFGSIKIKYACSNGGHNGIKSLDSTIGNEYFRLKIGIGRREKNITSYVLEEFEENEKKYFENIFSLTNAAINDFINGASLLELQNKHNKKHVI